MQKRNKLNILVVDDDVIVQIAHKASITSQVDNSTVSVASSAEEALAMIEDNYDAIFIDVNMPGINGIEATKIIRARERNRKKTLIVGVTSHVDSETKNLCLEAGMNEVICKPVLGNAFRQILQRWSKCR